MNIVNKLTVKHMRMNRRRTIVTIMGVIISAAMITAVAALGLSFLDMMMRDSIARSGLWHVKYGNVNEKQLAAIEKDGDTRSVIVKRDGGYAALEHPASKYRPYLHIEEYNETALKSDPIHLTEGRLPSAPGEMAVTEDLLQKEDVGFDLGDTVTLELGERHWIPDGKIGQDSLDRVLKQSNGLSVDENGEVSEYLKPLGTGTYTVVGVIETPSFEYSYYPGYTCLTYFEPAAMAPGDTADAYVELTHLDGGLFHRAGELAKANGIGEVGANNELLRYSGIVGGDQGRAMLYGLTTIIMVIIIIGAVSLIYNAFAISVSERFRHLGMLASVGATARQKRNSVFFEGFLIGLVSIPIGMVCGILGIETTFRLINPVMQDLMKMKTELRVVINPGVMVLAALLSALTIFISVYVPARRASKVSPIDAIRQTADVRMTEKSLHTSRLTTLLFGVEGNVALKNLKRNRRRYKATVFSLVISIVLFLTVSFFGENLKSSFHMTMEGVDFDTYVSISTRAENPEKIVQALMSAQYANKAVEVDEKDYFMPEDSGFDRTRVIALDDQALRDYAQEVGVSPELLLDPTQKAAIVIDTITYQDKQTGKYIKKKIVEMDEGQEWIIYRQLVGESGQGSSAEQEDSAQSADVSEAEGDAEAGGNAEARGDAEAVSSLTVAGFTDKLPAEISTAYDPDGSLLVVSKETGRQVFEDAGGSNFFLVNQNHTVYMQSDQPQELQAELETLDEPMIYINSTWEMHRSQEQLLFLMSVFVYGFITLITLICVANIFNTISTSISLRRREFAMLRSVGMTPEGFNRMIRYESIFYGMKALLYGIPISVVFMLLLYKNYMRTFEFAFRFPWSSAFIAVLAVFVIVFVTMRYSSSKVKRENIIDVLRQENI